MTTLVKSKSNLLPAVPQFFDDLFVRDLFTWPTLSQSGGDLAPAVNIIETPEKYLMEVAAPGLRKENFSIELDNDTLTISAESKEEKKVNDVSNHYTRREFNYLRFKRNFNLPEKLVDINKISAKYENGILHISIPKTEISKTQAVKQIIIS